MLDITSLFFSPKLLLNCLEVEKYEQEKKLEQPIQPKDMYVAMLTKCDLVEADTGWLLSRAMQPVYNNREMF